ncbi:MAG: helix-turn-helix domain-containing protein [Chloroflexi bacterium]|nr:helix-turn-helix domain-containing protein [Chloroflexota bacterium]MBU1746639.1 helix-turn-helix domain-containing protein [Chloroflexota bacterium]
MVPRGRVTSLAERIAIGERWTAGQTDPEIAAALSLSVWTVRKWRRRYQQAGRAGLASRLGRPPTGALGQFPPEIRDTIRAMRAKHPGWGPLTIRTELAGRPYRAGQRSPSRSRIAAYLQQEHLTRQYERHSELPQASAEDPQQAHEEWEMDAQGVVQVAGLGSVAVINITDLVSRVKVASWPVLHVSRPSTPDYQVALRQGFGQYGLPQRITLDHDSVFYDNTSASPFPLPVHLWLIGLGIEVRFITQPPPAAHSVIERTHQTVAHQAFQGQVFTDGAALQDSLTARLEFLNTQFPSRALGGQPPLVAHPEARHSGRPYRLEWEAALLDMQRVYDYLAQGRWFRRTSGAGQFSLGGQRYGLGRAWADHMLEITFDPQTSELICRAEDGQPEIRRPIAGLTKSDLMGELDFLMAQPAYQLALPFSPAAWREMMLANRLVAQ